MPSQGRHLTAGGGGGVQRPVWRVCEEKKAVRPTSFNILASRISERHTQVPMKRRRPVHCWTVGSTPPLSGREDTGTPEVRSFPLKGQFTVH